MGGASEGVKNCSAQKEMSELGTCNRLQMTKKKIMYEKGVDMEKFVTAKKGQ